MSQALKDIIQDPPSADAREDRRATFEQPDVAVAGKWSPRATLLFIVISCSLFWVGLAVAVYAFTHHS